MNPSDKRLLKGEETYNRILHAAIDIISKSGIRGISASKLSASSQVSKSNIFHHFKSTEEIPEAVLKMIFDELILPLDATPVFENLHDFLMHFGLSVITTSEECKKINKAFFSFYHESMFNDTYKKILGDYLATVKDRLTLQIRRYLKRDLSDKELNALSSLILSTLDGIGLHTLMKEESREFLEAWNLQVELICSWINN